MEFYLKTVSQIGLIFYQGATKPDFLGIELTDGKIRLLLNKGNGPTELIHDKNVNDGKWHRVIFEFNFNISSFVSIKIDENEKKLALPTGNKYLDLSKPLYVGGVELNKRAKAISKGFKSKDISFKGCIKNMILDKIDMGLPDVKISQGIVTNCVWGYPCADTQPCIPGAICSQLGIKSFTCDCEQSLCIKNNYTDDYKVNFFIFYFIYIIKYL